MVQRSQREIHLYTNYGLSLQDFNLLVVSQGGLCAICGHQPEGNLAVDHDHHTGKVRGLLCSVCNTKLRQGNVHTFSEDLQPIVKAYLRRSGSRVKENNG